MSDSAEAQPYKYNGPVVTMLRSFDQMRFSDAIKQIGPAIKAHPVLATGSALAVVAAIAVAVDPKLGSEVMAAGNNVVASMTDYLNTPMPADPASNRLDLIESVAELAIVTVALGGVVGGVVGGSFIAGQKIDDYITKGTERAANRVKSNGPA